MLLLHYQRFSNGLLLPDATEGCYEPLSVCLSVKVVFSKSWSLVKFGKRVCLVRWMDSIVDRGLMQLIVVKIG